MLSSVDFEYGAVDTAEADGDQGLDEDVAGLLFVGDKAVIVVESVGEDEIVAFDSDGGAAVVQIDAD